jgi:hypothetical protein
MAHIITNKDGSFRAAYKDLGPDSLKAVEQDFSDRGATMQEVTLPELYEVLAKERAIAAEREAADRENNGKDKTVVEEPVFEPEF